MKKQLTLAEIKTVAGGRGGGMVVPMPKPVED
ncbi:hypothetical protein N481_12335 [Pseudoalteromonas luteoviolacea S4047-1]|uniref:Uncharacterized protein n=1 Tax=Pseudoalteromonas luteoviolacea S4054 TaxID=1129367 RepID=A0A0F6ACH4_9GAMM|nr:hypothetical protein N479_15670 [Pseudoalteromonas luteoviolacea S4054]KZN73500.1 hypothetical protein N481_12335 [Pseudoalteromonas luteoviolacea S4047-1]